jgi:hypothetical protein
LQDYFGGRGVLGGVGFFGAALIVRIRIYRILGFTGFFFGSCGAVVHRVHWMRGAGIIGDFLGAPLFWTLMG